MNLFKKLTAAALCSAMAVTMTASPMPLANGAKEIETSLANDSGLDYDFARALQYSIYFYDANMCGTGVDENNRYKWRGDCHTYDAQCELIAGIKDFKGTNLSQAFIDKYKDILDPDGDGCVDVSGGFHDAGDHVEFGMPENYAAATLGWGYYEFRDAYKKTGQDDHLETIVRYFNDYLMKCTFRDNSGKVIAHCYQVGDGDNDHSYWNSPEMDEMPRPAFFLTADKPQIDYTASAAASLALNYLNFKETDPEYAEKCLDYANALWDFSVDALERFGPDDVLSDNADGPKGYYRSEKWVDDFCWAAGWLFLCTGDKSLLETAAPYYDYYAPSGWTYCWNDVWSGAACLWARINQEYPDVDLINMIRKAQGKNEYVFENIWEQVAKCLPTWQALESPQGYAFLQVWGSARYNTAMQLIGLVYDKYTNNGKPGEFSEWAKKQMEYIMGNNDMTFKEAEETGGPTHGSRSLIVGYNENSVKYPHHRASSGLTKCEDRDEQRYVLYGALAGGADSSDAHNDLTEDWVYNEVTIDYNAAFVGACAGLYEYFGTEDMQPTKNFPPDPSFSEGENGGGNNYWVEACGIDDLNADGAGVTKVSLYVKTDSTKGSKDISVRYYFSGKEISNIDNVKASKLYDQAEMEASTPEKPVVCTITGPHKYDKMDNMYYIELSWGDYKFANSAKKSQFTVGLYYGDKWDPSNDPSYQDLKMYKEDDAFFRTGSEVRTDNICVYDGGVLVGGIEPDGSVPVKPEVTTTTAAAVTTTTTSSQSTSGNDILYGDANCDGKVNIADAVLIMQAVANADAFGIGGSDKSAITAKGKENADCYKPGSDLTSMDALAVQQKLVGLITLPVE